MKVEDKYNLIKRYSIENGLIKISYGFRGKNWFDKFKEDFLVFRMYESSKFQNHAPLCKFIECKFTSAVVCSSNNLTRCRFNLLRSYFDFNEGDLHIYSDDRNRITLFIALLLSNRMK